MIRVGAWTASKHADYPLILWLILLALSAWYDIKNQVFISYESWIQ